MMLVAEPLMTYNALSSQSVLHVAVPHAQDLALWSSLAYRQAALTTQFGSAHTKQALKLLAITGTKIPQLQELNEMLWKSSEWTFFPACGVDSMGSLGQTWQFRTSQIPVHLRGRREFDAPIQQDYFSSVFGLFTTLMLREFADFMCELGRIQAQTSANDEVSKLLADLHVLLADWSMILDKDELGVERRPGLFGARLVSCFHDAQQALKFGTSWVKPSFEELLDLSHCAGGGGFKSAPKIYPVIEDWGRLKEELNVWFTNWQSSQQPHHVTI